MLIVGDDKLSRKLTSSLKSTEQITIAIDKSSNIRRIAKLLCRKTLTIRNIVRIWKAELLREDHKIGEYPVVTNNYEVLELIRKNNIQKLFLFRAGLIINKDVIENVAQILNIHCAKLPEYGGLGVISRALGDKAYDQVATLHQVTERIDDGEILATEPYTLVPTASYMVNENIAYDAGIRLLNRVLRT
jgi:methionyl-tRNA formyltransferase